MSNQEYIPSVSAAEFLAQARAQAAEAEASEWQDREIESSTFIRNGVLVHAEPEPEETESVTSQILRWVALLPAIVLGTILALVLSKIATYFVLGQGPISYSIIEWIWKELVSNWVAAWAIIFTAIKVAPKGKAIVAMVFGALVVLFGLGTLTLAIVVAIQGKLPWTFIVECAVGVVALFGGMLHALQFQVNEL